MSDGPPPFLRHPLVWCLFCERFHVEEDMVRSVSGGFAGCRSCMANLKGM